MGNAKEIRVALIGAGPRGTSVLERLLANWANGADRPAGQKLHIDVIDPFPPGPGRVWRLEQSRLYLMNTQSFFPTVVPSPGEGAPSLTGLSFNQWRDVQRRTPSEGLSETELGELKTLESGEFPSRALYGRYLQWTFDRLLSSAPSGVTIAVHQDAAVALTPARGGFDVELSTGATLAVGLAVLSLGHLDARLSPDQQHFMETAPALGLGYWPPAVPADVDWDAIPARRPVLVRGMGLNFFDVVGQLTEGRGGRFVETGGSAGQALSYVSSGQEPLILAASRRGTPYTAKAKLDSYYPASVSLRFLTSAATATCAAAGVQLGFNHDLWPLLYRDALWAYYTTLARACPEAFLRGAPDFLELLDQLLQPAAANAGQDWEAPVTALIEEHVSPIHRLKLLSLAVPLAGRTFGSQQELDFAVRSHLEEDARRSDAGENDPVKMAIGALNEGRAVIKDILADRRLADDSWVGELRGWFEPFVEGLASGPPALRVEQLGALVRAGVVHFVGPDPKIVLDPVAREFVATSPWVDDEPLRASALVEALTPVNHVGRNTSPLLEQLRGAGLVRPKVMMSGQGTPVETSGWDLTGPPYRPMSADDRVVDGLYVMGLQLSSVVWGTSIAAEAAPRYRSGQRTLRDADAVARDILRQ